MTKQNSQTSSKKKREKLFVLNSRITTEQAAYIKSFAEKKEMTQGEALRFIIQAFINL
jgi:hypothetical protein